MFSRFYRLSLLVLFLLIFGYGTSVWASKNYLKLNIIKSPRETSASLLTSVATYSEPYSATVFSKRRQSWVEIPAWANVIHQKYQANNSASRTIWDGEIYLPSRMTTPTNQSFTITQQTEEQWTINPISRYSMGSTDETFVFTPSAKVGLQIPSADGKIYWVAPVSETNQVDSQLMKTCRVENGYCVFETEIFNQILIFEKDYKVCPISNVTHGKITKAPSCEMICDSGYQKKDNQCLLNKTKTTNSIIRFKKLDFSSGKTMSSKTAIRRKNAYYRLRRTDQKKETTQTIEVTEKKTCDIRCRVKKVMARKQSQN